MYINGIKLSPFFLKNVTTPKQYFPLGEDDEKKLGNLLRDFNKTVSYIRAGGDTMRTFRYVGSVASMFAKHKRVTVLSSLFIFEHII